MPRFKVDNEEAAWAFMDKFMCQECKSDLSYITNTDTDEHFVACMKDESHAGFISKKDYGSEAVRGAKAQTEQRLALTPKALSLLPREALEKVPFGELTTLIQEVGSQKDRTAQAIIAAVLFAREVGARPEIGEVMLYHGKPFLTDDYWFRRFREKHPNGKILSWAIEEAKRGDMLLTPATHAWLSMAIDEYGNELANGYGYAMKNDTEPLAKGSAVEPDWPWMIAQKRAIVNCIKKVCPLGLQEKEFDV